MVLYVTATAQTVDTSQFKKPTETYFYGNGDVTVKWYPNCKGCLSHFRYRVPEEQWIGDYLIKDSIYTMIGYRSIGYQYGYEFWIEANNKVEHHFIHRAQ